ncbi:unnamed protein product, partial [Oppiella nova]
QYNSYAEVLKNLKNIYDSNRLMLGKRDVIRETVETDINGNVIKVDGKVLRKFVLSDSYKWLTVGEVVQRVDNIAKGLVRSGVKSGDNVIIWADTRLEWTLCSLALVKINATLATLYSTLGTSGLIYGINQTEAKTIVTTFDLLPKLKSFLPEVPNLKTVIYMQNTKDQVVDNFPEDISIKSFEELEESGAEDKNILEYHLPKDTNETAVIMYTSGTTGDPKAVCISHKSLMVTLKGCLSNSTDADINEFDRHMHLSYLPLAHIMGFSFEMFTLFAGIRVGYSSPLTLTDSSPGLATGQSGDAKLLKPTFMAAVPLVLDRMLKEIYDKLSQRSPISAPLFTYLMDYKIRWKARGYDTPIINRLLCGRVAEAVGGRLEYILAGGAAVNPRTQAILKAALNCKISQGYGATEAGGGAIANHWDDLAYNTTGIPVVGYQMKLVDWPEGGYLATDKPNPRGELLIGGDQVSNGYYKAPELTAESFTTDSRGVRWFRTGDIVEVLTDGSFRIIDRKKDLAKLANGEYISLGKIESTLKSCQYVENICVIAISDANCVVALVTPNHKSLLSLGKQLGKPNTYTRDQLCADPSVCDKVCESIRQSAQLNGLTKIEIPVKIKLCAEEWTADNNMITAAMKLKRNNVTSYYKSHITDMIDSINK